MPHLGGNSGASFDSQVHRTMSTEFASPEAMTVVPKTDPSTDPAALTNPVTTVMKSMEKIKLSKVKMVELERAKVLKAKLKGKQKNKDDIKTTPEEDIVTCECGDSSEDGDMVIPSLDLPDCLKLIFLDCL